MHVYGTPGQVEAQLAGVQPLIDAARTAVGGIKADHINEVCHTLGRFSWVLGYLCPSLLVACFAMVVKLLISTSISIFACMYLKVILHLASWVMVSLSLSGCIWSPHPAG